MTYIPRLSPTQWAWTQNPTECLARLKERAANLFADGYDVTHLPAIGTFLVKQEGKQGYTVDIVNQTCTCPFFTKAEIPQCPTCKHLLGLAALVEETILLLQDWQSSMKSHGGNGSRSTLATVVRTGRRVEPRYGTGRGQCL